MKKVTNTMQDYLETIYLLEKVNGSARVSDIAEKLSVAKSSVHTALHSLSDSGFILHEKYGDVNLTDDGREIAQQVYSNHLNLKSFFKNVLNLDDETAEKDACASEHILSEQAIKKMTAMVSESENKK